MSELVTKYREFITFLMGNVSKEKIENLKVVKNLDEKECEIKINNYVCTYIKTLLYFKNGVKRPREPCGKRHQKNFFLFFPLGCHY